MTDAELKAYTEVLRTIVAMSETGGSIEAGRIGLILVGEVKRLQLDLDMCRCVRSKETG